MLLDCGEDVFEGGDSESVFKLLVWKPAFADLLHEGVVIFKKKLLEPLDRYFFLFGESIELLIFSLYDFNSTVWWIDNPHTFECLVVHELSFPINPLLNIITNLTFGLELFFNLANCHITIHLDLTIIRILVGKLDTQSHQVVEADFFQHSFFNIVTKVTLAVNPLQSVRYLDVS